MIALWKKELILKRLKEENNGNLDYLTVDDVTIEAFGAKNQLRTIKYKLIDEDKGINSSSTAVAASTIDFKLYGGRFEYDVPSITWGITRRYNQPFFQKYIITGKPDRFVIGKFIIAVRLLYPENIYDTPANQWMNITKPKPSYSYEGYLFRQNLVLDTAVLKGRNIDDLDKNELVKLLPTTVKVGPEDFSEIKVTHIKKKEESNYWDSEIGSVKTYPEFEYIKLDYFLKMTEEEAGFYYGSYSNNIDENGLLKPNVKCYTFYIISKDVFVNASKFYYGGNTDNLKLSYEDGYFKLTGIDPVKENLSFSTIGLSILREDCPEFANMQWDYFFEFFFRGRFPGNLYIHNLSKEVQKIIIDTLARFHHWKWGSQNQPDNYSEIPSTHNLKGAIILVSGYQPYKYTRKYNPDAGTVSRVYPSYRPAIFFNRANKYKYLEEHCEVTQSITLHLDEKYNTGYEGILNLQIFTETTLFDAGVQGYPY